MKKVAVIYIPGFGSNKDCDTAKHLAAALGDGYEVIAVDRDENNPWDTMRDLHFNVKLMSTSDEFDDVIVVGSSLGGFYANYIAMSTGVSALLVNPSLRPSRTLGKYGVDDSVLQVYNDLEHYASFKSTRPSRTVLVALDDDVVDPKTNGMTMDDVARVIIIPEMGHRLTMFDLAADEIRRLRNNVWISAGDGD